MFQSLKYSNIALRFGIGFIFIWFGVDKFIHPDYWVNAWYPRDLDKVIEFFGLGESEFFNIIAIAEILIGASLFSGFFMTPFSVLGIFILGSSLVIFGLNEILMKNIAIIAGFVAIILWPSRDL